MSSKMDTAVSAVSTKSIIWAGEVAAAPAQQKEWCFIIDVKADIPNTSPEV